MSEMMDLLNASEKKASEASGGFSGAAFAAASMHDAQNQLRHRQDHILHLQNEITEGRMSTQEVGHELQMIDERCPNSQSLDDWRMLTARRYDEANLALGESRELAMKARDLESARITYGGDR